MSLGGVEECHSHDLAFFVPDDDVVVGEFGVVSMAWLLEVHVQHVCVLVVVDPDLLVGNAQQMGHQCRDLLYFCYGHIFAHAPEMVNASQLATWRAV